MVEKWKSGLVNACRALVPPNRHALAALDPADLVTKRAGDRDVMTPALREMKNLACL